jgi:hypothetical protein
MAFQKTPEQIAEEQRLLAERYPEASDSGIDPTQVNRDALQSLFGKGLKASVRPESPFGQELSAQEDAANAAYTMPADLKDHAYNLFPALNDIAPKSPVEIPFAPEEPSREPANLEAPEAEIPEQAGIMDSLDREPAQSPEEQSQGTEPAQEAPQDDIAAMIEASSRNADNASLAGQMAKVRDAAIGAGLGAKFQHDDSMYKQMAADADKPIKKFLLAGELKNTKAKNDPNSEISKLVRDSLKQMGMSMDGLDGVSYAQIEKIYPSLTNAIMTKYANDGKREERNLLRDVKAENKASADLDRVGQSIDKQINQLRTSKEFTSYEQAKSADALLQAALSSKSPMVKVEDAAGFMNYAKAAQGDDSVVRSEDMKVLAGNMGFNSVSEMLGKFSARAKGSSFSKGELQAMSRVLQTIKSVKREKIQQRLTPVKYKADMNGYDLNQSITPEYLDEIFAPMPLSIEQKAARLRELKAKQGK